MHRRLTFEAALRDLSAERPEARALALRCLPVAYLERFDLAPPVAHAARLHPDGARAVAALEERLSSEPDPELRGIVLWTLAMLGDPAIEAAARRVLDEGDAPYVEESALWSLGIYAELLDRDDPARLRIAEFVRERLADERFWVRMAAAAALVGAARGDAEEALVRAFEAETEPRVRAAFVEAFVCLDPPGPAACEVLVSVLNAPAFDRKTHLSAAVGLAAARRIEGAGVLADALRRAHDRDEACEALAVIAPELPDDLADRVASRARKLARSVLTPGPTRVRAAYLLARIEPDEGLAWLDRLERRGRGATLEAVADARAALERLASEA